MASGQVTHANGADPLVQDATPSDPSGAVTAARKRVAAGDLSGAVKYLALYVGWHPQEIEPARYLADLYYRQADFSAAERTLKAILAYAPNDRGTHDRLGGIYAAQDRIAEATVEFQKSLPETGAYGHLVDLHRRLGDLTAFEHNYREQADIRPDDASAQYAIGTIYEAEHKPQDAVVFLSRALELSPHSCPILSELGDAYLDTGAADRAVTILTRCLQIDRDDYSALVNLGAAQIALRQYDKSSESLKHANRVHADGPEALVDLGYLEDVAGHSQAAVAFYLRAIAVDPLSRDAYVDLGYDYTEQGLYPLAEAAFLKGLSVVPNDGRLHYLLGVTYADQGKRALARQEYERATKSDEPEVASAATRDLQRLQ